MLKLVTPEAPLAATAASRATWAFLSYSHHDKADARRLQEQLETYRVRRLVGRVTSRRVPAQVARCSATATSCMRRRPEGERAGRAVAQPLADRRVHARRGTFALESAARSSSSRSCTASAMCWR